MNAVLSVRDLAVRIDGSHILDRVTFSLPTSGITLLLGRNGVGKSTTMKAILGLVPTSARVEGEVTFNGIRVTGLPTHQRVRLGIGYVPADRGTLLGLTVAENLRLAELPDQPADYDMVFTLFPEFARRSRKRAASLSAQQRRMLMLARVLLNPHHLLLVDEPTKGLGQGAVLEVADLLEHVAQTVAVLLVEQSLAMVRRVGRDAIILADGLVAYQGPIQELLLETELTRSLLGIGQTRDTGRHHIGSASTSAPSTVSF
jgi:branched-chain amino acid transport system ATP-binding protein